MKSIDRLMAEHDIIKRGLTVLERVVAQIDSGGSVPDDFAKWTVDFLRNFADECHHAKEEDLLFPLLRERGVPQEGGPIGAMLQEHDIGRDCVRRMRTASQGDELDTATFTAAAKEFIPLLRQHIDKENNILYPMAVNCMSEADDAQLIEKFSTVERERELVGKFERYDAEVAGWEKVIG